MSTEKTKHCGKKKRRVYPAYGGNPCANSVCRNFMRGTCVSRACKKKHPGVCMAFMQTPTCKHGDNCNYTHVQPYNKPRRPSAPWRKSPHTPRRHRGKGGKPRAPSPHPGRRRRGKKGNTNVALIVRSDSLLCTPCGDQSFRRSSDQASTSIGHRGEGLPRELFVLLILLHWL